MSIQYFTPSHMHGFKNALTRLPNMIDFFIIGAIIV